MPMPNLLETAKSAGTFKTLLAVIEKASLTSTLEGPGPFTVLAPTDEAFAKLPKETLDALLEDLPKLNKVVAYHVLSGDVREEDLAEINEAPTLEGSIVAVDHDGGIRINEAKVVKTDILTDNGVIHIIDTVLMPAIVAGET